ncbi:MAG: DUF480 domain-containing protein [Gemmataceae bacterium]|nr:DUF480 domain-containing protein [Gemmataceae bacterium]
MNPQISQDKLTLPGLDLVERRVLGVLIEKAKTTPENYPLSLNSLLTGCNQKSNRDPLMNLDDARLENCIRTLIQKTLVSLVRGGRVERWQHELYTRWNVSKQDMAILGELFLRGPQTEGLLRSRASRMEPFDSLEELRASLDQLAQKELAIWVDAPGSRGARVSHGFHSKGELENLGPASVGELPSGSPSVSLVNEGNSREKLDSLQTKLNTLEEVVKSLQEAVARLESRIPRNG